MVDLEEWENEDRKRCREVVCSLLDRVEREEKISLLDLAPEYREILRERTYGLWLPPGDIQEMLQRPLTNLASMLDRGMPVPSILLAPLNLCRSKEEFKAMYGLVPEMGGPSYDIFLQEIREGRILPVPMGSPTYYKGDLYQEILKACEEGEIQQLPPPMCRILSFMEGFSPITSTTQKGIPPGGEWVDLFVDQLLPRKGWIGLFMEWFSAIESAIESAIDPVLQERMKHALLESWVEKVRSILSDEKVQIIQKKYPFMQNSAIAARIYRLLIFGFSGLANLSLELLRESPLEGFYVLDSYDRYLVYGYSLGLGGLSMYDGVDLWRMTFLGIIKNMQKRNSLRVSPASFGVVGTATKIPIVVKFDEDDLKNSLRRERDRELEKCMLDSMRAFQKYNFWEFCEKNKAINEIIAERIVKETREYYRRSKIVEGMIIPGGTLTAAGARAAYKHLQPLLEIIISEKIPEIMKKRKEMKRWLVSKWPFQQRGLPFYLWLQCH
jgi:hypothetical protein